MNDYKKRGLLRLRKSFAVLLFLFALCSSSLIGFYIPQIVKMIYEGGGERITEVIFQGKSSFNWLPIWVSIITGVLGGCVGVLTWVWGIRKGGLLSQDELQEFYDATDRWGLLGALKTPSSHEEQNR